MHTLNRLMPLIALDMLIVFVALLFFRGTFAQPQQIDENLNEEQIGDDLFTMGGEENPASTQAANLFTTEKPLNVTFGCPEQCRDQYESCKRRKHYCGILMYHKMMTKACPVSCGRCVEPDDCFDLRRGCVRHRCNKERYSQEMQHGCAKTCKFCVPFTCSQKKRN